MSTDCAETIAAVVFIGPSLRAHERPALRRVALHAPVRRGDLPALARTYPMLRAIGIVDGVFHHALSITPREVLDVARAGLTVFGASSMGALRAAELHTMGVRGVGRIFEMYAEGLVVSDDEVAIAFDPESERATSEPLVNVRCALGKAVLDGLLASADADVILAVGRELPYVDRTYTTILRRAGERLGRDFSGVRASLVTHDQKRLDALALFRALDDHLASH